MPGMTQFSNSVFQMRDRINIKSLMLFSMYNNVSDSAALKFDKMFFSFRQL